MGLRARPSAVFTGWPGGHCREAAHLPQPGEAAYGVLGCKPLFSLGEPATLPPQEKLVQSVLEPVSHRQTLLGQPPDQECVGGEPLGCGPEPQLCTIVRGRDGAQQRGSERNGHPDTEQSLPPHWPGARDHPDPDSTRDAKDRDG